MSEYKFPYGHGGRDFPQHDSLFGNLEANLPTDHFLPSPMAQTDRIAGSDLRLRHFGWAICGAIRTAFYQACPKMPRFGPTTDMQFGFPDRVLGFAWLGSCMLGLGKLPIRASRHRIGAAWLAVVIGLGGATPALSIDANRPSVTGLIPVRAVVQPPSGAKHLCSVYDWACARSGRTKAIDDASLRMVMDVNLRANRSIRAVSDLSQYRIEERWALPTKRGGDCEDYALFKKNELIKAGIPPEQLLIAAVLDRNRNSHAVLVLRTGKQDLILDNLTNRIVPWHKTGYTFLRLQDPQNPARWLSAYAGGIFPLS